MDPPQTHNDSAMNIDDDFDYANSQPSTSQPIHVRAPSECSNSIETLSDTSSILDFREMQASLRQMKLEEEEEEERLRFDEECDMEVAGFLYDDVTQYMNFSSSSASPTLSDLSFEEFDTPQLEEATQYVFGRKAEKEVLPDFRGYWEVCMIVEKQLASKPLDDDSRIQLEEAMKTSYTYWLALDKSIQRMKDAAKEDIKKVKNQMFFLMLHIETLKRIRDQEKRKTILTKQFPRTNFKKLSAKLEFKKLNSELPLNKDFGLNSSFVTDTMMKTFKNTIATQIEKIIGPTIELLTWAMWTQIVTQFLSIILQIVHMCKEGFSMLIMSSIVLGLVNLTVTVILMLQVGVKLNAEVPTQFIFDEIKEFVMKQVLNTPEGPESLLSQSEGFSMVTALDSMPSEISESSFDIKDDIQPEDSASNVGSPRRLLPQRVKYCQDPFDPTRWIVDDSPHRESTEKGQGSSKAPSNVSWPSDNSLENEMLVIQEDDRLKLDPAYTGEMTVEEAESRRPMMDIHAKERNPHEFVKKGLSVPTIISLAIGSVTLGLTIANISGVSSIGNLMKDYNTSSTFTQNLNKNISSVKDMVETVAEEAFGWKLSSATNHLHIIRKLCVELDRFIMSNTVEYQLDIKKFYEFKDKLFEATSILTVNNKITVPNVISANNLLLATLVRAKSKFERVKEALASNTTRQETLCVHIVGQPGHGKTHFVNNYLVPELNKAMGWADTAYAMSFGSQPEYFPIYNGADVGIMDEFLALKGKDPLIPHLNLIASQSYCNFPHAQIEHKTQPCNLKVLFLISNCDYVPLGDLMMPAAVEAFYSRLMRFQITNTKVTPGMSRNEIYHSDNFAELQLDWCPHPATNDEAANKRDAKTMAKEEMLQMIIGRVKAFEAIKRKDNERILPHIADNLEKKSASISDNVTFLLVGQPGHGKSVLANKLGTKLSQLTKLPLNIITTQPFGTIDTSRPSIYVTHDRLTDEAEYLRFYDRIAKPSLIINTANLKLSTTRVGTSEGQIKSENLFRRAINYCSNWYIPKTIIKGTSQRNQEPGFIRRIGIPGNLYHMNQISYRSEETGGVYIANPGFIFTDMSDNVLEYNQILENMYTRFNKVYTSRNGVIFKKVEDIMPVNPSVRLIADDIPQLKDMVNSSSKCLQAYVRGCSNNLKTPYIQVSGEVLKSTFAFSPQMFYISDCDTVEKIKDLAERAYSTLLLGGSQLTVHIIAGNDFECWCKEGVIEYRTTQTNSTVFTHELERGNVVISRTDIHTGVTKEVAEWKLEAVVAGLENGFVGNSYTGLQIELFDYLMSQKASISATPEYKALLPRVKVKEIIVKTELDEKLNFVNIWSRFTKTLTFKIIVIILSLLALLALVNMTLGLFSFGKNLMKSNKADDLGLPNIYHVSGKYITLKYDIKGRDIHVVCIGEGAETITCDELSEYLAHFYPPGFENMDVVSVSVSNDVTKKNYTRQEKKNPNGKGRQNVKTNNNRMQVFNKLASSGGNSNYDSIKNRILQNHVVLRTQYNQLYGFGLTQKYIVSPAHIWFKDADTIIYDGYVSVQVTEKAFTSTGEQMKVPTLKNYPVVMRAMSPERDIAICEITDKTAPSFKNIIKYIPSESELEIVREVELMRYSKLGDLNSVREVYRGYAELNRYVSKQQDKEGVHYIYHRMTGFKIPIIDGDCGSPLFAYHSRLNAHNFAGFVTGLHNDRYTSEVTVLTQELILSTLEEIKSVTNPILKLSSDVDTTVDLLELDMEVKHPANDSAPIYLDDNYAEWFSLLEEPANLKNDVLWFTEARPENKLVPIGFHPKTMRAESSKHPYHEGEWMHNDQIAKLVDELEIKTAPSIISRSQLSKEQIEALPTVNGVKSLIGSQICQYNDILPWSPKHQESLDEIIDILQPRYDRLYGKHRHRKLTTLEVINGLCINSRDPYADCLEGIDLDTSSGHYARTFLKTDKKRPFFIPMEGKSNLRKTIYDWNSTPRASAMRDRVMSVEFLAQQGKRAMTVVQDCLKREVTKAGKVRVFQAMDLAEIFLIRKYYGTLMAAVQQNHKEGHCQLGIDPVVEFDSLYKRFSQVSISGEAGDFKRWDKHMTAPLLRAAMKLITQVIVRTNPDLKEEYANIEKVVGDYIIHSICLVDNILYQKHTGNPSGNVLTTIINSVVNDIYHVWYIKWAIEKVKETVSTEKEDNIFNKSVKELTKIVSEWTSPRLLLQQVIKATDWASYGDDYIEVIEEKWQWMINFKLKQIFFREVLNLDYDTPNKDGKSYTILPLEQLGFLSRTFDSTASGLIVPRLKIESITSMTRWTQNEIPDIVAQQMQDCITEVSAYDEKMYNKVTNVVQKISDFYLERRGKGFMIDIPTYSIARRNLTDTIRHKRRGLSFYPENSKALSRVGDTDSTLHFNKKSGSIQSFSPLTFQRILFTLFFAATLTTRTMATGQDQLSTITNSKGGNSEPVTDLASAPGSINVSNSRQQLFRGDLVSQAYSRFWVKNLVVPVNQEAGVTLAVIPYGDMEWMSTPMRAWASMHSLFNGSIEYEFQFVTASTIVNNLMFGLSDVVKAPTAYTIEELQVIQWETTNANSDIRRVVLNYATPLVRSTVTDGGVGPLTTGINPNDTIVVGGAGSTRPTLVIKALTGVQNSFANDNVSINVVVYARFLPNGGGTNFFFTSADMARVATRSLVEGDSFRYSNFSGMKLSDMLKLPKNHPLYVTCDGNVNAANIPNSLVSGFTTYDAVALSSMTHAGAPFKTIHIGNSLQFNLNRKVGIIIGSETNYVDNWTLVMLPLIKYATVGATNKSWIETYLNNAGFTSTALKVAQDKLKEDNGPLAAVKAFGSRGMLADGGGCGYLTLVNGINVLRDFYLKTDLTIPDGVTVDRTLDLTTDYLVAKISALGYNVLIQDLVNDDAIITTFMTDENPNFEYAYPSDLSNIEPISIQYLPSPNLKYKNQNSSQAYAHRILTVSNHVHTSIYILTVNFPKTYTMEDMKFDMRFDYLARTNLSGQRTVAGRLINSNINCGILEARIALNLPSNTITRLTEVLMHGNLTINPEMSIIEFANTLPPTLTSTIAESGSRTVIRDPSFHSAWLNNLRSLDYDKDGYNVRFNLTNSMNMLPVATVTYDGLNDVFIVLNNPTASIHNYVVYPKVVAEEVIINNFQIIPRGIPLVGKTDTTGWISRTIANYKDSKVFNGIKLSNNYSLTNVTTAIRSRYQRKGSAMAGMVAANGIAGIGQGFQQMILMSEQFKQMDKMQQANLLAQAELLDKKIAGDKELQKMFQDWKMEIIQQQQESQQAHELNMQESGHANQLVTMGQQHEYTLEEMREAANLQGGFTGVAQQQRNNAGLGWQPGGVAFPYKYPNEEPDTPAEPDKWNEESSGVRTASDYSGSYQVNKSLPRAASSGSGVSVGSDNYSVNSEMPNSSEHTGTTKFTSEPGSASNYSADNSSVGNPRPGKYGSDASSFSSGAGRPAVQRTEQDNASTQSFGTASSNADKRAVGTRNTDVVWGNTGGTKPSGNISNARMTSFLYPGTSERNTNNLFSTTPRQATYSGRNSLFARKSCDIEMRKVAEEVDRLIGKVTEDLVFLNKPRGKAGIITLLPNGTRYLSQGFEFQTSNYGKIQMECQRITDEFNRINHTNSKITFRQISTADVQIPDWTTIYQIHFNVYFLESL